MNLLALAWPSSATVTSIRLDRRWPPVALALMLWGLVVVAQLWFTTALGLHPFLLLLPFVWALHGLLLTWPLHELMRRTETVSVGLRWLMVGIIVVVLAILQAVIDSTISSWLVFNFAPRDGGASLIVRTLDRDIQAGLHVSLMIYVWVFGCYAMADGLLLSLRRLIEAQGAAQRAELTALRLQLHPHFMFNALNSVSALIVTGRHSEADATAMNLAAFLRASLLADHTAPIALAEELEAIEAYLEVERVRFGERLDVQIEVPDHLHDASVPAFLLQPLIENAIKHAVAPGSRRIEIIILARLVGGLIEITVSDNGASGAASSSPNGTGTGLRNIRERLAALYGPLGTLRTSATSDGFSAQVTFPVRPAFGD